jgi:hypothetical protein
MSPLIYTALTNAQQATLNTNNKVTTTTTTTTTTSNMHTATGLIGPHVWTGSPQPPGRPVNHSGYRATYSEMSAAQRAGALETGAGTVGKQRSAQARSLW